MNDPEFDKLLNEVPVRHREKVAEVVNLKARKDRSYDVYIADARMFRAGVRSLVLRHGLSKRMVGKLLGLGATRIGNIVEGKKDG